MFTKLVVLGKTITIPFSSRRVANGFIQGFNNYVWFAIQEREYPCRDEDEQRGAKFAETVARYIRNSGEHLSEFRLEVYDDKENQQSLFDGFF